MRSSLTIIYVISSLTFIFCDCSRQNDFPVLKGPYLGQKPPGITPEVFAPGIISTGFNDYCSIFSPDGKEFYFGLGSGPDYVIICTRVENQNWAKPEICSFSGKYNDSEPSISYDGKRIAFRSYRPMNGEGKPKDDSDIWIVERTGSIWSEPTRLPPLINTDSSDFYPAFSRTGDLYFSSDRNGDCDIYVSRFINGQYGKPEKLSAAINSKFDDWDA